MGLPKGKTNNKDGRPKGAPNKATKDLREWVTAFIDRNTAQLEADWEQLEPKDRVLMFEKLLKYTLPTLQSVDSSLEVKNTDFQNLSDEDLENMLKTVLSKIEI